MAVKILIKRKIKHENRKGAMKHPGYISSETLRSLDDPSIIVVVSMWQNKDAWETWKNSETRIANEAEFEDYVVGSTVYEHYSLGLSSE